MRVAVEIMESGCLRRDADQQMHVTYLRLVRKRNLRCGRLGRLQSEIEEAPDQISGRLFPQSKTALTPPSQLASLPRLNVVLASVRVDCTIGDLSGLSCSPRPTTSPLKLLDGLSDPV